MNTPLIRLSVLVLPLSLAVAQAADNKGQTTHGAAQSIDQPGARAGGGCGDLPKSDDLRKLIREAPKSIQAGGFAGGAHEWAAIVNRKGELCALAVATGDEAASWPGSRGIAMAKAFTANGFSSDTVPMSTARLYTMSLPGHSLWGAANGNPLNPVCLGPADNTRTPNVVCGGTIAFGGGLPLYKDNTRVGGLGLSGDTPCADHEIAKRVRDMAHLNPAAGAGADDIMYSKVDGPSIFTHPLCPDTWRNGKKIGDEQVSSGY